MRKINVCAGIGDNIWLLQKLLNAGEPFEYLLPTAEPQRGKQIFDMLPKEVAIASYDRYFTYNDVRRNNIWLKKKQFHEIIEENFFLECNWHLEHGYRIENFFPDLSTSFRINWRTCCSTPPDLPNKPLIGIYGSSYNTSRAWGFWKEDKWYRLIDLLHKQNPDFVFVIIGAKWDTDLAYKLMKLLELKNIPYLDTIGRPLGEVTEIMKKLLYFFSFPSGLGILAPTVQCPVTMFYPDGKNGSPNLGPMINTWAAPEDIESGVYKGCLFCEPEKIFDWVINSYKLMSKL